MMVDRPGMRDAPNTLDGEVGDPVLKALWIRVLEAWDDDKPHAALLDYGLGSERMPEKSLDAIGRSRRTRRRGPGPAANSTRSSSWSPNASWRRGPPRGPVPLPITLTVFAVCVLLLAWVAWALWGPR